MKNNFYINTKASLSFPVISGEREAFVLYGPFVIDIPTKSCQKVKSMV